MDTFDVSAELWVVRYVLQPFKAFEIDFQENGFEEDRFCSMSGFRIDVTKILEAGSRRGFADVDENF